MGSVQYSTAAQDLQDTVRMGSCCCAWPHGPRQGDGCEFKGGTDSDKWPGPGSARCARARLDSVVRRGGYPTQTTPAMHRRCTWFPSRNRGPHRRAEAVHRNHPGFMNPDNLTSRHNCLTPGHTCFKWQECEARERKKKQGGSKVLFSTWDEVEFLDSASSELPVSDS